MTDESVRDGAILVTGGTGFIGRRLCRALRADGRDVVVSSRRPARVPLVCGNGVRGIARFDELDGTAVAGVVNLAGASIAGGRWSDRRKAALWHSRVTLTEELVRWLDGCEQRPAVLVSGSAVGYYGDGGDQLLDEAGRPHEEFTHALCYAWEAAARRAEDLGIRVCLLRTGLVVGPNGGFLRQMLLPFRLGLGGRLGDSRQWMSWIHLDDEVALIRYLLDHETLAGAFNATAPHPVRNAEFTDTLAALLHRPAIMTVPAPVLRVALGEMSRLLLTGQRAVPAKALEAGFEFRYEDLDDALRSVLGNS